MHQPETTEQPASRVNLDALNYLCKILPTLQQALDEDIKTRLQALVTELENSQDMTPNKKKMLVSYLQTAIQSRETIDPDAVKQRCLNSVTSSTVCQKIARAIAPFSELVQGIELISCITNAFSDIIKKNEDHTIKMKILTQCETRMHDYIVKQISKTTTLDEIRPALAAYQTLLRETHGWLLPNKQLPKLETETASKETPSEDRVTTTTRSMRLRMPGQIEMKR